MTSHQAERIHWIDIAKGIFMLEIVQGHIFTDGVLRWWLYSFHVPAFFFISGYCFKSDEKFSEFIKKKVKGIVIPYFFFSLLSIFLFALLGKIVPSIADVMELDIKKNISVMLYANSKPNLMRYNLPLWFLPCLFSVSVLVYFSEIFTKTFKSQNAIRIWLVVFILLGVFFEKHELIALPWHLETACSMSVWYLLGFIAKNRGFFKKIECYAENRKNRIFLGLIAVAIIIVGAIFSWMNVRTVGVRNEHYGIIPVYYLSAVLGIVGHIILSISFRKNKLLEHVGKNTLGVLGFHKFAVLFFQKIIPFFAKQLAMPNTFSGIICGGAVNIATVFISLMATRLTLMAFPWALGKRK